MGNLSTKDLCTCPQEENGVVDYQEESEQVISYRRKTMTDALLVFDSASEIESYVPRMLGIDNSSIVGRRRAISELSNRSLALASLNSRSHEKRKKKPTSADKRALLKKLRSEQIPQVFQMEELSSPTLLKDLMEFAASNSCSRLNY